MTDADEVATELARIDALARRRWRRFTIAWVALVLVLIISGITAGVLDPHRTHHRHDGLASIAGLIAAAMIIVAGIALASKRKWRGWDAQVPLSLGLPWAIRRRVAKNLRRGTPNVDSVLREVEFFAAAAVAQYRQHRRMMRFRPHWERTPG